MAEALPAAVPQTVRNISDTARWAAYFRAQKTARSDAIFRDPFAERLCGQHGVDIANTLPEGNKHAWAWGRALIHLTISLRNSFSRAWTSS